MKSDELFAKFEVDRNLDQDFSYLALFSIISHLKKNSTLKNWMEKADFKNLSAFYDASEITEIKKILKKSSMLKSSTIRELVEGIFQKSVSNITYDDIIKILPKTIQKKFAIYYTKKDVSLFIGEILKSFSFKSVLDPACGNGRLLDSVYEENRIFHGIDLFSIAFSDTSKHRIIQNYDFLRIDNSIKNKKKSIHNKKFDLVIMNPPYTRFSNLNSDYRKSVLSKVNFKSMPQMGLHGYFIIHSYYFLNPKGLLVAVLPASILFSKHADELRLFLLNNFSLKYIISYHDDDSFSDYSNFKEIILIAEKNSSDFTCNFISLKNKITAKNYSVLANSIVNKEKTNQLTSTTITKDQLSASSNWSSFLINKNSINKNSTKLKKFKSLNFQIRRGTESFGPDFFYLPNKFWNIQKRSKNSIFISNSNEGLTLEIPKKYLVCGIIRTKPHTKKITVENDEFFMSIPPLPLDQLPQSLQKYVNWGSKLDLAMMRHSFSKTNPWYSFLHHQLQRKSFYGSILLLRKLRFNTMGVIAHYNPEKLPASKAFYIILCPKSYEKIIVLWLNSTYFLEHMANFRRRISANWGELMISDLLEMKCVDPSKIDKQSINIFEKIFDCISSKKLPSIADQKNNSLKQLLNETIQNQIFTEQPKLN